ncbi:hypothetical protein [Methanococcoides sp. AM1]|uniref:hypothetical protein n=1 Tax=Methanococcoides sp. AM1 TaxID=1201011 RepID=UPI00108415C0|nr:hypothetical protein [Methanococcoides sp. AM1]
MSQIQSSLLSENPVIEGNSVTLPIVKVGTKAYDANGKEFTLTKCALESGAESWKDGIATVNHKVQVDGKISKSWFEDPYVYATFEGLSQETIDVINSAAYRGTSQESVPVEVDGNNVLRLKGTGSTFVIFPENPACTMDAGCGVIASTEAAISEEERHVFDVAVVNNVSKQVKVKEISVWLYNNEADNPDALKEEITRVVGYDGLGIYFVYDRDESLSLGDEMPDDREPVHTVTITVSNSPVFNFPLNSQTQEQSLDSTGGNKVPDNDEKITQLESTIKQKEGLISTKDQEIADLKSTNTKLEDDLKAKDGQIASTVQAAVKAALESHDAQAVQKADLDAAVKDLASCMPPEALESFMKTEPSVEVIKSTTAAIKSAAGTKVGSPGGQLQSTDDGGSLSSMYLGE